MFLTSPRPVHLGHPCTWQAFRDMRCNAMGRTSRTCLVFFLPLITLLHYALHLTLKVLSLDIDLSQSRDAIKDRSRNNGCRTRHTFLRLLDVLFCGVEFLLEENNISGEAFLSSLWATLRRAETQEGGARASVWARGVRAKRVMRARVCEVGSACDDNGKQGGEHVQRRGHAKTRACNGDGK